MQIYVLEGLQPLGVGYDPGLGDGWYMKTASSAPRLQYEPYVELLAAYNVKKLCAAEGKAVYVLCCDSSSASRCRLCRLNVLRDIERETRYLVYLFIYAFASLHQQELYTSSVSNSHIRGLPTDERLYTRP